jgi:hypothetical protein
MKGEFLTFSKPLKTLARKFDHPIPIIANTITIIKNIAIRALNSDNIYQNYYKNTFCLASEKYISRFVIKNKEF